VRSERQEDLAKLQATFVDFGGILDQLDNDNNQILFGRRGTGKTHVLKVLQARKKSRGNSLTMYIDSRTLGTPGQAADGRAPSQAALYLFRDVFNLIHETLLSHLVDLDAKLYEPAFEQLVALSDASNAVVKTFQARQVELRRKHSAGGEAGGSFSVTPAGPGIAASASHASASETEVTERYGEEAYESADFSDINVLLAEILTKAGLSQLYVLLDEWSSIDTRIQPYLAEFLKRGLLANPRVTVKIASLEYRSSFNMAKSANQVVGFEMGGDISASLDLDDYYVYDRNPEAVTEAFASLLYRHLASELPPDYMDEKFGISTASTFQSRVFTSKEVFAELVRASEGVARDLINVFCTSYYEAQRNRRDSIDKRSVIDAARAWYEKDKATNLTAEQNAVLSHIITEVIGVKQSRSFLLEKGLEKHEMIQSLFDLRVLHIVQRGYADKDNPGLRYNIYALDYGTYVDLQYTSKKPQMWLMEPEDEASVVVPFDDKRSIRRIILRPEVLNLS
jgi:hypothetical protein